MDRERSILHFNVADFAVAVERAADVSLRRRPLIVAPLQAARAVVYDMSEEAFRSGVRKGMPLRQASARCRGARVVPPRIALYRRAMAAFLARVRRFAPLVEHGRADGHLYADVTGTHRLFGPAPDIGWRVRREVSGGLGIDPIWTLSSSKLVAKVASRLVKPVGEYIVGPGEEEDFLAPLPVLLLPGVGRRERSRLEEFNIRRIGELAALSREELVVPFGSRGGYFYEASRGIDRTPVDDGRGGEPAVARSHFFADDTNDHRLVERAVMELAGRAGAELRRTHLAARRVVVGVTYSDGVAVVRQISRKTGSASDFVLREMALSALRRAWQRRTRLRSCRLVCDRLHRLSPQLSLLPLAERESAKGTGREQRILEAMDLVRHRFGGKSIDFAGCGTAAAAPSRVAS